MLGGGGGWEHRPPRQEARGNLRGYQPREGKEGVKTLEGLSREYCTCSTGESQRVVRLEAELVWGGGGEY